LLSFLVSGEFASIGSFLLLLLNSIAMFFFSPHVVFPCLMAKRRNSPQHRIVFTGAVSAGPVILRVGSQPPRILDQSGFSPVKGTHGPGQLKGSRLPERHEPQVQPPIFSLFRRFLSCSSTCSAAFLLAVPVFSFFCLARSTFFQKTPGSIFFFFLQSFLFSYLFPRVAFFSHFSSVDFHFSRRIEG